MTDIRPIRRNAILCAALAALSVAVIGGTITDLGPWYQSLKEPAWKPPDIAFGPIWTTIFALAAMSGLLGWRHDPSATRRHWMIGLFALNGFFNILWSLMFFQLKRPDLALVEVGALWLSVLALMLLLWPRSKLASLLLAPYLLWVSAAALLNEQVVALNGPFN